MVGCLGNSHPEGRTRTPPRQAKLSLANEQQPRLLVRGEGEQRVCADVTRGWSCSCVDLARLQDGLASCLCCVKSLYSAGAGGRAKKARLPCSDRAAWI